MTSVENPRKPMSKKRNGVFFDIEFVKKKKN